MNGDNFSVNRRDGPGPLPGQTALRSARHRRGLSAIGPRASWGDLTRAPGSARDSHSSPSAAKMTLARGRVNIRWAVLHAYCSRLPALDHNHLTATTQRKNKPKDDEDPTGD